MITKIRRLQNFNNKESEKTPSIGAIKTSIKEP